MEIWELTSNSPQTLWCIWILSILKLKLPLISIGLTQVIATRRYRTKTLIALIWYRISYSPLNYHRGNVAIHFYIDNPLKSIPVSLKMSCWASPLAILGKEMSYSHLLIYLKDYAHGFICSVVFFLRTRFVLMWSIYPYFPGLISLQCGYRIIV